MTSEQECQPYAWVLLRVENKVLTLQAARRRRQREQWEQRERKRAGWRRRWQQNVSGPGGGGEGGSNVYAANDRRTSHASDSELKELLLLHGIGFDGE